MIYYVFLFCCKYARKIHLCIQAYTKQNTTAILLIQPHKLGVSGILSIDFIRKCLPPVSYLHYSYLFLFGNSTKFLKLNGIGGKKSCIFL